MIKINSLQTRILALAVPAAALVSCEITDDYNHVDNNAVEFSVAADVDGGPSTRATRYGASPVVMLGEGGCDTLYLHASIDVNTATVTKEGMAATRGVPVNTLNFPEQCKSFGVTAYTEEGKLYMSDEEVGGYANGVWSPNGGVRYWPENQTLHFYAYAPYSFKDNRLFPDGINIDTDQHNITFTYTVPTTTDGKDAEAQPDIMFADTTCSRDDTDGKGTVPLTFRHALAAVKFVAGDIAGCTINSITLHGLRGSGSCEYNGDEDKFTWTIYNDDIKSFKQTFDVELSDQPNKENEQPITDKNPATTFMMLPQQLGDATVEVDMTTKNGEQHTLVGKLNIGNVSEWEAGKIYTYKISSESINWTYVFEVKDGNISLPLGGTSGIYNVISYRYRTQNPSVKEPVAWSVKDGDISGTETQYGSSDDHNEPILEGAIKDVLVDFTYNDKGGGDVYENGTSYPIQIERTFMHTTYTPDTLLKDPSRMKGTPENPYDLSTEGGAQSRTTANCYVVGGAGTYKLPLVYGNAIVKGQTNSGAYSDSHFVDYNGKHITNPWIKNSGGTPHDCALVWSDGFYMFKDVHLSDDGDYLVFTLDQEYMQQANAILAVRDANGTIMWSWHIWVIERDINATTTVDDYFDSNKTYQIMSCNLGWVDEKWVYYNPRDLYFTFTQDKSGNTDDLHVSQAGAKFDYKDIGSTYYQWGRKEPIVALMNREHTGVNDYRRLETSDPKYQYKVQPGLTSMADAIKNPNVYYAQPNNTDIRWLADNSFSYKFWNMESSGDKVDITKYKKTVYDPSPKGFVVPIPRAFSVFVNGSTATGNYGGNLNGKIDPALSYRYLVRTKKNQQGAELPFTATGQRSSRGNLGSGSGSLWALDAVYYWSSESKYNGSNGDGEKGKAFTFVVRKDHESEVYSYGFIGTQAMARPVRCIRE